jgi:hypothetical protein
VVSALDSTRFLQGEKGLAETLVSYRKLRSQLGAGQATVLRQGLKYRFRQRARARLWLLGVSCHHLEVEARLAVTESTIESHERHLGGFLAHADVKGDIHGLRRLSLEQVDRFLVEATSRLKRTSVNHVCAAVRGFLRYLHMRGVLEKRGYSASTVAQYGAICKRLGSYLEGEGIGADALLELHVNAFLEQVEPRRKGGRKDALAQYYRGACRRLLEYLREIELAPRPSVSPKSVVIEEYLRFLRDHRKTRQLVVQRRRPAL